MPVEHANLTGASLHEPKGVASATTGTLYRANGSGSGAWTTINNNSVPTGFPVQVTNTMDSAVQTEVGTIPYDDTIPQNSEGDEVMTHSHTPLSTTNKLKITVVCNLSTTVDDEAVTAALFQDAVASALAAAAVEPANSTAPFQIVFEHVMTADTVSAISFKVRVGTAGGVATVTFNGDGGSRRFGGVIASSITVTEFKA